MSFNPKCICCGRTGTLDIRYFYNLKQDEHELEYHCVGYEGGCGFYRIIPMNTSAEQVLE